MLHFPTSKFFFQTDKRKKPEVVDTETKESYPEDDVLYQDTVLDVVETDEIETEGQTEFEIATLQANVKSVSVNAITEVSDKETQYEVMIPNFSLGFGIDKVDLTVQMDTDDSLDQAIVVAMKKSQKCFDVGTQTNIGNTHEDAIVIY